MKTSTNSLFMSMMIISTMALINSPTWISTWICLEINMMSFIPLMNNFKNKFIPQGMMMYFLIQSMSSMMFISLILINNLIKMDQEMLMNLIITMMMIKMGMPPMHLWFTQIINKMTWPMCFTLLTWQKIAPTYIMSSLIKLNKTMMLIIITSVLIGSIFGLNQTSTHKIMAYSSINHMGWLMTCCACHNKSWSIYLIFYSMNMFMLCMYMYNMNIMYINQMNMFSLNIMEKMLMISLMLSLGGIPPFLGFLPKWMAINYMILSNEMMIMLLMTIASLITLTYYLRMISSINLLMSHSQKWMLMSNSYKTMITWMITVNNMLPMMILCFNFF